MPEDKKASSVGAVVRWFAFLFSLNVTYENGKLIYKVKILGRQILGNEPSFLEKQEEKEVRKKKKTQKKKKKKKNQQEEKAEPAETLDEKPNVKEVSDENILEEKTDRKLEVTEKSSKEEVTEKISDSKDDSKKKETKKVQKDEEDWEEEDWDEDDEEEEDENSEGIITKIQKLIKTVKEKWEEYHMKENLPFFKELIIRTLKHILPRKLSGNLSFGLDDPQMMGYATAAMAMMYPTYGRHFAFTPYFHSAPLLADCRGRGKIRLGFLVYIVIRLLFNKDVRKIIFS